MYCHFDVDVDVDVDFSYFLFAVLSNQLKIDLTSAYI
jgi:hypothetical protein